MAETESIRRRMECQWCGTGQEHLIKKGSQVRCIKCRILIPTFKRELTENKFVGRKHIHTTNK